MRWEISLLLTSCEYHYGDEDEDSDDEDEDDKEVTLASMDTVLDTTGKL